MRTYQVTERVGELLGPVDWSYDFMSHFNSLCGAGDNGMRERCEQKVAQLRQLADGSEWYATTDGGWPRIGYHKVIAVGMYDGWPYWRPVPSVCMDGVLGPEWASFDCITSINKR